MVDVGIAHAAMGAGNAEGLWPLSDCSAENPAEQLPVTADMTYDQAQSHRSMEKIWEIWRRRPGTILVPGHDVPMRLENGVPVFIGPREAAISAWFGDDLERTTLFSLVLSQPGAKRAAE